MAVVCQFVTAGVAQHMRMALEDEPGRGPADPRTENAPELDAAARIDSRRGPVPASHTSQSGALALA
jgi:hypothetical protein